MLRPVLRNVIIVLVGSTILFTLGIGLLALAFEWGYGEECIVLYLLIVAGMRFYVVWDKRHDTLPFRLLRLFFPPTKR